MSVQPPAPLEELGSLSAVPAGLVLLLAAKKAKLPVAATIVFPPALWRDLNVAGVNLYTNNEVLHQWYDAYSRLKSEWVRVGVVIGDSVRWIAQVMGENALFSELSALHGKARTGEPLWVVVQASPASGAHGYIDTRHGSAPGVAQLACWPGEPNQAVDSENPASIFVRISDESIMGESQTSARYQASLSKQGQPQLEPISPTFSLPQKTLLELLNDIMKLKRTLPDHLNVHYIIANKKPLITNVAPDYGDNIDAYTNLPRLRTQLLLATGSVGELELTGSTQADGVGILRSDYLWSQLNQHPLYLFQKRPSELRKHITAYLDKTRSTHPTQRVVYRLMNFNSDELRNLQHGKEFEEKENNPYLGCRGAHWYLSHPEFLRFELDIIADWAEKRHAPTGVLIPFVRDHKEWLRLVAQMEKLGCWDNPLFELWLQLNTPENVSSIQDYLHPKLRGVILHVKTVAALAYGIDPDVDSLTIEYRPDSSWAQQPLAFLQQQTQHTPQRLLKYVFAEDPDPGLLELVVQNQYDGVVASPQALAMVRAHLVQFETAQTVKEQIWQ